ncbi:DUF106 domain-containing protein [Candidatus Thorarchaeota archaeon]|nr:MAG: DUF106 domain-containing protein [Candidatus Thorarchaeota archaeon]
MDFFSDFILLATTMPWSVITILLVNFLLMFISIYATNRFTDVEKTKENMAEIKAWQDKMKAARKSMDPIALQEVMDEQGRIMRLNSQIMSSRMKPMCIYYLPFLAIFYIMGSLFGTSIVAVIPFNIQKVLPFLTGLIGRPTTVGFGLTFYGFYLLVGIGLGNLVRKPFGQSITA